MATAMTTATAVTTTTVAVTMATTVTMATSSEIHINHLLSMVNKRKFYWISRRSKNIGEK
jgi:hypothetical protein